MMIKQMRRLRNLAGTAVAATVLVATLHVEGAAMSAGGSVDEGYLDLDQNWSQKDRRTWYGATQGSRLVPLAWLRALERPDGGGGAFLGPEHAEKLRYLPSPAWSKTGLPLGFAVQSIDDTAFRRTQLRWYDGQSPNVHWVGMNCAACHTGEITYNGLRMRIDGGASLADFQGLMMDLNEAIRQTLVDEDGKFERFAEKVLNGKVGRDGRVLNSATQKNKYMLKEALKEFAKWRGMFAWMNDTNRLEKKPFHYFQGPQHYTDYQNDSDDRRMKYGFGRLDAVGHIFNKVATTLNGTNAVPVAPDAPVSYPFLWNVPQHDRVQWNGIARKSDLAVDVGGLGRNTVQVIGVFADLHVDGGKKLIKASADVDNLIKLEELLEDLRPPKWPDALGKPDASMVEAGRDLFRDKCHRCHDARLNRTDLSTPINASMSFFSDRGLQGPPGTDPWMACNAYHYKTKEGPLAGKPSTDDQNQKNKPMTAILPELTARILVENGFTVAKNFVRNIFGIKSRPEVEIPPEIVSAEENRRRKGLFALCVEASANFKTRKDNIMGYKARPLVGIWATAPYLHNGSVPTLYDLLLPAKLRDCLEPNDAAYNSLKGPFRPESFFVGAREYDVRKVGYVAEAATSDGLPVSGNDFRFNVRDENGNRVFGNCNSGHDYGTTDLTDKQRYQLVEYMKTL